MDGEKRNNWGRILGQIYKWASRSDTANKTTLTAAILPQRLEPCDCSSLWPKQKAVKEDVQSWHKQQRENHILATVALNAEQ